MQRDCRQSSAVRKQLIMTGDDFGLAVPVNEAIEQAHRRGVLNTASLMVSAPAAADAVARAKALPSLKVGLHVVLVQGAPVLPAAAVPKLVNDHGEFSSALFLAGINFFFLPGIRRQLEAEIRAQFESFRRTGLPLDHVNAHNHMHLHPTVLSLLLKIGKEYGMRAMRLPYEPPIASWRASGRALPGRLISSVFLAPWIGFLRFRLRRAGVHSNQFVFGLNDSGRLDAVLVQRFIQHLPDGVTEMYFHPAIAALPEDHCHQEFQALVSTAVRDTITTAGIQLTTFSELQEQMSAAT